MFSYASFPLLKHPYQHTLSLYLSPTRAESGWSHCMHDSQCRNSPAFSPGGAALCAHCCTPLTQCGAAPCGHATNASLSPYCLCMRQFYVLVPQCFASSTLSSGVAAPHERTLTLHYLYTFFWTGSPAGRYLNTLLLQTLFRCGSL